MCSPLHMTIMSLRNCCRFPITSYSIHLPNGNGCARLWRRIEARSVVVFGLTPSTPRSQWICGTPAQEYSRFGVKAEDLKSVPEGIEGLHFHALCEQNSDTLERLLAVIKKKFGNLLSQVKWVNFGGGQLITGPEYDIDRLCRIIADFRREYAVDVYMEPGQAVGFNAGILLSTVLEMVRNEIEIAILDTSPFAHIPDILNAPYKPDIIGGGKPNQFKNTYRLASRSCLSGDIIGDYSFPQPLHRGSRIMFSDMASYCAVSNNFFNGIPLPAIAILTKSNDVRIVRQFGYMDYEARLS